MEDIPEFHSPLQCFPMTAGPSAESSWLLGAVTWRDPQRATSQRPENTKWLSFVAHVT